MFAHINRLLNLAFLTALLSLPALHAATETVQASSESQHTLPGYNFPYSNPLYATLAGYLEVGNVDVPGERVMNLCVGKFSRAVPVHAVIQEGNAPLIVVLPGISARADANFTKLWPMFYAEAGYNVLWFDSTFRPEFMDVSGRGVSGNVWSESAAAAEIIATFLRTETVQGHVSKVGIVGMSYGAVEALIIGKLAKQGKVPFEISAIQAWSPPLDFQRTAEIFDRWYSEDRWRFTLAELGSKVGAHVPDGSDCPPFSNRMMRAAIAASFHEELRPVVLRADTKYHLDLLPHGDQFTDKDTREYYADAWGFQQYAYDLALPYWETKIGPGVVDNLIIRTRLEELVKDQPGYVEVILAADDPFNTPEDKDEFLRIAGDYKVTVLERGGHLGYVGNEWTRAKLLSIFHETNTPVLMSVNYNPTSPVTNGCATWRKTKERGFIPTVRAIFGAQ